MKPGWKTAKLKDVSTIIGGSTPKTDIPEYWGGDNYWVAPAELDGSKYISSTVKRITDLAVSKTNLSLLPQGTVLLSSRAPIGKVAITTVPMYCNQGFKNIVCGPELFNGYVYYFLKHNVSYLQSLGTGATFKEVSKKVVENVSISFPSLEEQHRIVDEMDLLTGIIDKKKAQLRNLDTLAQSIFYEMFGDPYTNNKNWSTSLLESMVTEDCSISYGIVQPGNGEIEGVPIVRPVDLLGTFVHNENLKKTTKEISDSYKRTILKGNELLLCVRGTTGIVSLAANDLAGCNVSRGITPLEFNKENSRWFMFYQFKTTAVKNTISELTHGIALKGINMADVRKLKMIQPPYHLQKEFEDKVVAINAQKERIKESIQELNSLLQSKMDGYFFD